MADELIARLAERLARLDGERFNVASVVYCPEEPGAEYVVTIGGEACVQGMGSTLDSAIAAALDSKDVLRGPPRGWKRR